MLILSRKVNEVIVIGDDIRVMVVGYDVRDGRVMLGIDAPRSIVVDREEVSQRRKARKENERRQQDP